MKPPITTGLRVLFPLLFLFLFFSSFAQSPGNVSTDLELWLKADAGFTVSQWDDQSGNSNNATQGTSGNQPSSISDAINFNPAISFDGNDYLDLANNASTMGLNSSDYEIFMVMQSSDASSIMFLFGGEYERYEMHLNGGNGLRFVTAASQYSDIGSTGDYGTGQARIMGATVDGGTSASSADGRFSSDTESMAQSTSTGAMQIGRRANGTFYFTGDVAEAVIYGDALTSTERGRVLSYMSIKYGITLDQTSATNYLASDGGTIWDATTNASYKTDITGIGRDDNSDLDQQKSHSDNSNAILTIANGNITSPSSFSADDSFLIWGSDNGTITFGSGNITNADGTTSNRMTRIWKVDETGTVGDVEISFDNSLASGTVSIVIDPSDNTFANNANRRVIEMTDNGSDYEVTIDFEDGDLFSFVNASASAITTKPVLINEMAVSPRQDWSDGNFYNSAPGGTPGTNDEWVELYIAQDGLDLTSWTLEFVDGSDDVSGDLTSTGAFDVSNYLSTSGGTFTNTKAGDYLVLGNVDGVFDIDNVVTATLKNASGNVIDQVIIDSGSGTGFNGTSTDTSDESISRIPGETDTNDNSADWEKTVATLGTTNSTSGSVLINEVVAEAQQDWNDDGFNGSPGITAPSINDEWIELYIEDSGINLAGWTIEVNDGTNFNGDLAANGAFVVSNYVGSGTFGNTTAGDYLILGDPISSESMDQTQDITIILRNPSGTIVDQVTLGADAGEAPQGASMDETDESVSRYTNATDTDTDDADFIQTIATLGANNSVTGTVLINEVVASPQQDWSTNSFSGIIGSGTIDVEDEWIELYIGTAGINLTNWNISMSAGTGGTAFSGDLTASGAFETISYLGSGTFQSTAVGDYLVLGNPSGSGTMVDDSQITLTDAYGTTSDQTTLGQAAPTGISDESVARIANATDTNVDANDFAQAEATLGAENFVNPLPSPGYGLDFDGTEDYVSLSQIDFSAGDEMTIEAWVKPVDITTNTYYHINRQELDWLLAFQDKGTILSFGLEANSTYTELDVSITAGDYTDGNWHHIAAVYDGTNKYLYSDGVLIGTEAKTGNIEFSSSSNTLGSLSGASQFFDGEMDEIRFWSSARTHEEILENMFTTLVGNETNLVAYYNFDQTSGTTLPDIAGSNNGTLTNMDNSDWITTDWNTFSSNQAIVDPTSGVDVTEAISDELDIDETAFLNDDGDFILAGHDNNDFIEVTSDLPSPAGGTLVTARYDQTWHLLVNDESGTTGGNVTFSFDIGAAPNSDYTYYLLERTGTSGAFSIAPVAGVNPSGNNVVFTLDADDLTDGNYYTLGRSDAGVGNALAFDGTDDRVTVGSTTDFDWMHGADNTSAFQLSLSFWIKMDDPEFDNLAYLINTTILSAANTGAGLLYDDRTTSQSFDRRLRFYVVNGSGTPTIDDMGVDLMYPNDTDWHHLAVTYDQSLSSDNAKYYLDGVLIREETKDAGTPTTSASDFPLTFGAGANSSAFFPGVIDETQIWDDVRTQEEIIDNMFVSLAGDEANLRAYYRMNQGIGDENESLPDLTGNGHGGTLTNFNNLNVATASSNYVTSDRTTFSEVAFIINTDTDILSDASGELTISSTDATGEFLDDTNDQVIWGHDGGDFTETTDDINTSLLNVARMTRTWYIDKNDESSNDGNLTFSFALGSTPNLDYIYYLLERTGTSGDFSVVEVIGSEPNGNSIEFTVDGAEVTDENYFTLGRSDSGPGNALDFDGTNDYVDTGAALIGTLATDPLTLEAWVRTSATVGAIFGQYSGVTHRFALYFNGSDLNYWKGGSSGTVAVATGVNDGNWHHVAASRDAAGNVILYIDGVVTDTGTDTNIFLSVNTTLGGYSGQYLDGQLDEVRIWDDVRSISEIQQNMHRTLDVANESNLVAYYKFDQGDAEGTNTGVDLLTDHSGSNNSGTLTNFGLSSTTSNWIASESITYDAATNQSLIGAGNALDFDGVDDYVNVTSPYTAFTSELTIEFWVNATTMPAGSIMGQSAADVDAAGTNVFLVGNDGSGGDITFYVGDGSSFPSPRATTTTDFLGTGWHHVACVSDGTDTKVYVDGILEGTGAGVASINSNGSAVLHIGKDSRYAAGRFLDGIIDEVRIWNTVRTATQIQDSMFEELVGDETGLVAYYRFDEAPISGNTTLYDETSNNNDGTLTNMDETTDRVTAAAREPFKSTNPGNWSDDTTWKGNAEPTASTDLVNLTHDVTFDVADEVLDLNINSGVTLTLDADLTINGNLINNGTITGASNLIFNTGTPIITGGALNNVQIAGGITSSLQGALTINGTLDLSNGLVALDENDLIIGSSGSITRTDDTDYIQTLDQNSSGGYLRMQVANGGGPVVFPIGTTNYTPFTMTNLGTSSSFGVRVFDGTYTRGNFGTLITGGEEVDKTWDVDASGSGFNTTITIQWNVGDEGASFDRTNMFLSKNRDDGWWRPITETIEASGGDPYSASASGLTGFSEIGGGSGSSPLPVELTKFTAGLVDDRVELSWTTASELNNDFFDVQCSQDGENYMVIGTVDGNGDSNEVIEYSYTDRRPNQGLNYYRLRQVDYDGAFEFSPVRVVQVTQAVDQQLNVFPNPSKDGFTLLLSNVTIETIKLSLIDHTGRIIRQSKFSTQNQSLRIEFGDDLEPGLYILMAEDGNSRMVSRIIKE